MRAWLFQDTRQKAKLGESKCPWSVGWIDPDGRRRSRRVGVKSLAEKFRRKREGELAAGIVGQQQRFRWDEFRERFLSDIASRRAVSTRTLYVFAFDRFEAIVKLVYLDGVTTVSIDRYAAHRLTVDGVTPATLNKELRHLRAALKRAVAWKMLTEMPEIHFEREPERDPEFVDDAVFAKLYAACSAMTRPGGEHYTAEEWWQALLTFAYMTGWRIGEILALERDNLDLSGGTAFIPADKTKGRRDARIELHPVVIDHLRKIVSFDPMVFAWPANDRLLWTDFARLKKAAGVSFSGAFHRLRFGFANANVDHVPEDVLQQLMRHRDRSTTRRYVSTVQRMRRKGTADQLHVPDVLRRAN